MAASLILKLLPLNSRRIYKTPWRIYETPWRIYETPVVADLRSQTSTAVCQGRTLQSSSARRIPSCCGCPTCCALGAQNLGCRRFQSRGSRLSSAKLAQWQSDKPDEGAAGVAVDRASVVSIGQLSLKHQGELEKLSNVHKNLIEEMKEQRKMDALEQQKDQKEINFRK
uniref:39S ribosomal protein L52, mitochondrial n=1 Tax=Globodera rostochiensis TaxID=31243 RepID=A0A914H0I6_GLORO